MDEDDDGDDDDKTLLSDMSKGSGRGRVGRTGDWCWTITTGGLCKTGSTAAAGEAVSTTTGLLAGIGMACGGTGGGGGDGEGLTICCCCGCSLRRSQTTSALLPVPSLLLRREGTRLQECRRRILSHVSRRLTLSRFFFTSVPEEEEVDEEDEDDEVEDAVSDASLESSIDDLGMTVVVIVAVDVVPADVVVVVCVITMPSVWGGSGRRRLSFGLGDPVPIPDSAPSPTPPSSE